MAPLEMEGDIRRLAGHHTSQNPDLFDDFYQEMMLAVLQAPEGMEKKWYLWRATWRAEHWLRREMIYRSWHRPVEERLV